MFKKLEKLGKDNTYKRPTKTFQETLSLDEISNKLQGYEKVEDINEVPLNTHIRYFISQGDGDKVFRLGGFLHNKQNADTYIMLNNGKNVWSVQVENAIFFKKLSHKEEIDSIHKNYKKKLLQKDQIIKKMAEYIHSKIGKDVDLSRFNDNSKQNNTNNNKIDNKIKKSNSTTEPNNKNKKINKKVQVIKKNTNKMNSKTEKTLQSKKNVKSIKKN